MTRSLLATSLLALLAACSAPSATPAADTAADAPPPAMDQPAQDVPPATAPATTETDQTATPPSDVGGDDLSRFDGYGDMRFGIAAADMPKAWGGELNTLGKDDNAECYFMTPKWVKAPADFAFMVSGGKFARYGTEASKLTAPGGGKVGMSKAEIAALYPGRVEEQPHKYTEGQYLRVKDTGGGNGVVVFETDGKADTAKVTEWRVGVTPEVDYVEGCS